MAVLITILKSQLLWKKKKVSRHQASSRSDTNPSSSETGIVQTTNWAGQGGIFANLWDETSILYLRVYHCFNAMCINSIYNGYSNWMEFGLFWEVASYWNIFGFASFMDHQGVFTPTNIQLIPGTTWTLLQSSERESCNFDGIESLSWKGYQLSHEKKTWLVTLYRGLYYPVIWGS